MHVFRTPTKRPTRIPDPGTQVLYYGQAASRTGRSRGEVSDVGTVDRTDKYSRRNCVRPFDRVPPFSSLHCSRLVIFAGLREPRSTLVPFTFLSAYKRPALVYNFVSQSLNMASSSAVAPASTSTLAVPPRPAPAPLNLLESFMCGGLAGCAAVTVCESLEALQVCCAPVDAIPHSQHARGDEDETAAAGRAAEGGRERTKGVQERGRRLRQDVEKRGSPRPPERPAPCLRLPSGS